MTSSVKKAQATSKTDTKSESTSQTKKKSPPKRKFDNWLSKYMELTEFSESPLSFHFWTGVSVIAGALRRRVWIDERYFQWTPNFYIVLVGPPGIAAKSTSMRMGVKLLAEVPGVTFGPVSLTWQSLTTSLEASKAMVNLDPNSSDLEGLLTPMSCLTCAVSELGTFLRPDDVALVDLLVDMWDGQLSVWRRSTKTQGDTTIENPWLNIIGCTTPAWLRDNVPDSMIGGGFISRVLFVYGDKKRRFVPYPSDFVEEGAFDKLTEDLVHDLRLIAEMRGEFKLEPAAKAWGKEWYKKHWTTRPLHMASDRYGGYIARKQTHIHKLAIIFAASQRSGLVITEKDLKMAERTVTALEQDMNSVFKSIGLSDTAKNVREMVVYVRAFEEMPRQELLKFCLSFMSQRDFKEALETSISAGYLKVVVRNAVATCVYIPGSKFE